MTAKDRKLLVLGLNSLSMFIWAVYPLWVVHFGLADAIWATIPIMAISSGLSKTFFAFGLNRSFLTSKKLLVALQNAVRRRPQSALPIFGAIAEEICIIGSLRMIDPTVVQSLMRFYPVPYTVWLWRSARDRFAFNKRMVIGIASACFGAALVIWAAAGAEVGGGWSLFAGVVLVMIAVVAVATKSQELALTADVSRMLGPGPRKNEQALAIVISGLRNLVAGFLVLFAVIIFGVVDFGSLTAGFWVAVLIFGFILSPVAIICNRLGLFIDSNLALQSVHSVGALVTLGLSFFWGGLLVDNVGLLTLGIIILSGGVFWCTLSRVKPAIRS